MSRPRPVTATVTKLPVWEDDLGIRADGNRRHSLTSSGSTTSLTSVLEHDSYISETEMERDALELADDKSVDGGVAMAQVDSMEKSWKAFRKVKMLNQTFSVCGGKQCETGLSAWEGWLVRKVREERIQLGERRLRRKEAQNDHVVLDRERCARQSRTEDACHQWLQKKSVERRERRIALSKRQPGEHAEEESKERVRWKAEIVFREWVSVKQQERWRLKHEEKEHRLQEDEARHARQELAKQRFSQWLEGKHKSPVSSQKMTGYINCLPYPKPSYVNPIAWHPLPIQTVNSSRRRKGHPHCCYMRNSDK